MKHILFDLKDCPSELLDSEDHVRMSLYVAAKVSNSELLNITAHKFKPQGVTGLAMLAEHRSPRYIQDRMNSFLDPEIHYSIDKKGGGGKDKKKKAA